MTRRSSPPSLDALLGGAAVLGGGALRSVVLRGLPVQAALVLGAALGLSKAALAEHLDISKRTLERAEAEDRALPLAAGDRAVRLARLLARAIEVFEDEGVGRAWFLRAHAGLGGESPLELARTDLGAEQVELALGRLEHGLGA